MKRGLFLILVSIQLSGHSQKTGQALADSIIQILPSMVEDSNKVKALAKIGETFYYMAPAKGIEYTQAGLDIAEKLNYQRGISRMENLLGLLVGDTGNNTLSREYFNRSYMVNKKIGNSYGMISNLNNTGRSYQREADFASALDYFLKALTVAQDIKSDEQIALVCTNLTTSYFSQKDYARAMQYARLTLEHAERAHSGNNKAKALFQMGSIKEEEKDTPAAKNYFKEAYNEYVNINNKTGMTQVMVEQAPLLYPDYEKAIEQMKQTQLVADSVAPSSLYSIANLANLGNAYFNLSQKRLGVEKMKILKEGETVLLKALKLSRETENRELQAGISGTLSKIKEAQGDYRSSLENFKTYYSINDSLFSQEKKNQLAALESRNSLNLKDKALAISKLELAAQRRTQLGLLLGILALGIIGSLLIWQNRVRHKSNVQLLLLNNRLDEANRVKLKFFGILSHDLRSPIANLVNYLYLLKNEPEQLAETAAIGRQQIGNSVENLLQNLETVLLWSKEQMDHFKPDIRLVKVEDLFDYLRNLLQPAEGMQINYDNPDHLQITGDENYLRVILQNLSSNAINAIKGKAPGLIVWKAEKKNNQTILSIRDNGPGIQAEQIGALFSDDPTGNGPNGFGFHMILELARAMHYQITIESVPGEGTVCSVVSPPDA